MTGSGDVIKGVGLPLYSFPERQVFHSVPLTVSTSTELSTHTVVERVNELVSFCELSATSSDEPSSTTHVAESGPARKHVARSLVASKHHNTACDSVITLHEPPLRQIAQTPGRAVRLLETHSEDSIQTSLGHGAQPQPFRVDPTLGCAADSVHSGGWGQTRIQQFPVCGFVS